MKSIGIDIGSYSIKIAELDSSKEGAMLTNYKELKLSQDPSKDKSIEIIDHLKTYFNKTDTEGAHVIFALHQGHVAHRKIEFPFKERHSILKTIAFELEDEIPFSQENAVFDAKITHYVDNAAHVIATAAPKSQVEKIIEQTNDYSVTPNIISVEGLALTNLLEDWTGLPVTYEAPPEDTPELKKATSYVHIGHSKTILLTYEKEYLLDIRSLPWGSSTLAHSVSRKYNIPFSESIKEIQNKGFILLDTAGATEDQVSFSKIIQEGFVEFSHHLKLALLEISSDQNVDINQLYVMGASSQIKNIGPFLTRNLEVATNPHPFPKAHIEIKTRSFNGATGHVALGLAIEGLKKPRNPATNLLKGEFAIQSNQISIFWSKWSPAIKMSASIFFLLLVYSVVRDSFTLDMSNKGLDTLKVQAEKIAKLKGRKASIRNIQKHIKKQKKKQKQKQDFKELQQVNSALDIMKKITQATPQSKRIQLEIKRLNIQGESVRLEGIAHKNTPLKELKKALKNISSNKKILIEKSSLKITKSHNKSFAYSFKVNRK